MTGDEDKVEAAAIIWQLEQRKASGASRSWPWQFDVSQPFSAPSSNLHQYQFTKGFYAARLHNAQRVQLSPSLRRLLFLPFSVLNIVAP